MTNSRVLPSNEARELVSEILRNLSKAASSTGKIFEVVLRGDSTLRGHFLEEIESHIDTIGSPDAWIITPSFEQGGRVTIEDVHYVIDKDMLVPVANTQSAADKPFGFKSSNLAEYVREKAGCRFSGNDIVAVTLVEIRQGGVTEVAKKLLAVPKGGEAILNAVQEVDMRLFCLGLLEGVELDRPHSCGTHVLLREYLSDLCLRVARLWEIHLLTNASVQKIITAVLAIDRVRL